MAEDGPIDARYPLLPAPGAGNRKRTRLNVRDSDGTVIFSFGPLGGGSLSTCEDCVELRRPYLVIDADRLTIEEAAESAATFISDHDIRTLNVAGQRESEDVRVYEYVRRMMRMLLTK